jgi:hypothetical protein
VAAAEAYDMAVVQLHQDDDTARINFPDKRPDYLLRLGLSGPSC